jgi:HSP20 family protein
MVADLPGVNKEDLDIRVADNVLTLQAKASHTSLGDVVHREFVIPGFYRQFELGEEIDQEKITAELKHGVLTVRLPKVEQAKPRRVQVEVK